MVVSCLRPCVHRHPVDGHGHLHGFHPGVYHAPGGLSGAAGHHRPADAPDAVLHAHRGGGDDHGGLLHGPDSRPFPATGPSDLLAGGGLVHNRPDDHPGDGYPVAHKPEGLFRDTEGTPRCR